MEEEFTTGLLATIYHHDRQHADKKQKMLEVVEVESRLEKAREMLSGMDRRMKEMEAKLERAEARFLELQKAALEMQRHWNESDEN